MDELARAMRDGCATTADASDEGSRAPRCVRDVGGCVTRKMSVGEAVRACAAPAAKVLAHRALRDVGRRVDEATLMDIERLCEGTIAWACEEGRAVTISEVLRELESRLRDFEASLAAGWRGIEFSASNPESPAHVDVDDRRMDVFHSVAATKDRASKRGRVIDEWRAELLEKLEPEENLKSIIKPRLLLRAYELLSDRKVVNDDAVEDMVNKRFDKWMEMWRLHAQQQRRETGSAPDHEGFKTYLYSFLGTKLPAFANGVHKSSFKVQLTRDTETEKLAKEAEELERSARPPSDGAVTKPKHTLEHAIQALRAAETSNDVRALLTTQWMREALVDAPTFSQPGQKSSKSVDSGGQMMKDWQREEGFVLRFSNRHGGASSGNAAGFKNISDDAWKESYVSTGPFRVHFMRACAEIEAALRECSTCDLNNVSADEKREACVKGAARVMFVASRTMRSGDGLDFVHNLFGPPPEFSVSLVDPGKTKKMVAENSSIGTPIVVEITSDIVTIRCVDVFLIVKHCFADETNASNAPSPRPATEASDSPLPWACVALETTQTLRTASDGSLKLIKQRIAVDKNIPQPVLDGFLAASLDSADAVRAPRPPVRVSAAAFA